MPDSAQLEPGLYVVSTPIGAARDITLRALDVLRDADAIVAEDTRVTRKLMEIHGIPRRDRPLISYHDHNGPAQRPRIMALLAEGKSVAQVSDAGTPLVADPGFALSRAAVEAGHRVHAVPGPSALLAALVVSGMPSDRFLFAGFLPPGASARRTVLRDLAAVPATLVFFETGRKLLPNLRLMVEELGGERRAAVCRELTKKFEETYRGTLEELCTKIGPEPPKGEIVVLVERGRETASDEVRDGLLAEALKTMRIKEAAAHVADRLNLPKREVYEAALRIGGKK